MSRKHLGAPPQITFTSDFHQLVQGDLALGLCELRYDPLRLIAPGEIDTSTHHIKAHVRFHPLGSEWQGLLTLNPGASVLQQADISGRGVMLAAQFNIPEGADELEVWFSCTHEDSGTHYDSNFGENYWLRFGLADLNLATAKVVTDRASHGAMDAFEIEVHTRPAVDEVKVRWRITNSPEAPRQVTPLERIPANEPSAKPSWRPPSGRINVPKGAVVAFDVVYSVEGRSFTDDNQGRWYVAD